MNTVRLIVLAMAGVALRLRAQSSEADAMLANLLKDGAPAATTTPAAVLAPDMLQPRGGHTAGVPLATNSDVVVMGAVPSSESGDEAEIGIDTAVDLKEVVTQAIKGNGTDTTAEVGVFTSASDLFTGTLAVATALATTTTPEQIVIPVEEVPLNTYVRPGTIVGNIKDHNRRPVARVKVVLFNDTSYKTMQSTPGGNFAFNITESNTYTLTAAIENQFFFTNLFMTPGQAVLVRVQFRMPITVFGQLFIDGQPAQHGLFMRLVNAQGAQAGAIVMSNGYFRIARLTPERYTLVLERRKMFIDRRLDENRFYYVPITLTTQTARIRIERDRRLLHGMVTLDSLPRTHVDAIVIMKDARTNGKLIYREAPTYYQEGRFVFANVQPGSYLLQAVQRQREWVSDVQPVVVQPNDRAPRMTINVVLDKNAERKRIEQLRKQFMPR
ncbi:MAG: carboxypeptidase-like regulatory domain-containing protein [bacterium]|nr:carboxypeptidase-like regulatory domain-containing protein [bacterium]